MIEFAEKNQIPIAKDKRGEAPFSVDANLLHSSSEGKVLEDPAVEPPEFVYQRTIAPEAAPDKATVITVEFERGDAVGVDGERLSPAALLTRLNQLGHDNGIGRLDLVENRFVGMKSRGVYETPGGTILLAAHRGIESITLDRGAALRIDGFQARVQRFELALQTLDPALDRANLVGAGGGRAILLVGGDAGMGRGRAAAQEGDGDGDDQQLSHQAPSPAAHTQDPSPACAPRRTASS